MRGEHSMAYCTKCGAYIADDAKFCPSCGQVAGSAAGQSDYQTPPPPVYQRPVLSQDASDNRVISVFCYMGIMMLIPCLLKSESEFVKFHANQGLVILLAMLVSSLAFIVPFLGWIVGGIAYIIVAVCEIIGIVRCLQGKMIPVPIIGKYTVLK